MIVDKPNEPLANAFQMGAQGENKPMQFPHASPEPAKIAAGGQPADEHDTEELPGNWFYVAASPAMREVREQVRLVAKVDVPVLLLGESGTGKEVIARLIHKHSLRSERTFMKVNCTALPVELLESELFGYEAGAFTGARQTKLGKFEICHKGTILLDEIAEMPIPPQAKLLHVLQDGEFSRLGSSTTTRVDVRVLAATNLDISQALESRRLRNDLYYRLNAFTIQLPPLRARKADIPMLLDHFNTSWAERFGRPPLPMSERMLDACMGYSWPGNVRELENFVKGYLVLGDEERALSKLGAHSNGKAFQFETLRQAVPSDCSDLKSLVRGLKQGAEKEVILHALEQTRGSRKEAAAMLKISLRALQYKIREYGIDQTDAQSTPHAA
ncbi:MAG: sigma-54-dependent Fis family transcriptional regulator [Acidobacteria bacterium]|nr:MAG: sigma-54-dependent Fis family transcriptional regulator [Acidobacteriota bacterium]